MYGIQEKKKACNSPQNYIIVYTHASHAVHALCKLRANPVNLEDDDDKDNDDRE